MTRRWVIRCDVCRQDFEDLAHHSLEVMVKVFSQPQRDGERVTRNHRFDVCAGCDFEFRRGGAS